MSVCPLSVAVLREIGNLGIKSYFKLELRLRGGGLWTVLFFVMGVWSQRGVPAFAAGLSFREGMAREDVSQTEIYRGRSHCFTKQAL